MELGGVLSAAVTALLAEGTRQALTASAARSRARHAGAVTVYRLTPGGTLIVGAAILIMAGLAAAVLYRGDDWRLAAVPAAFAALCVLAYPGDVIVDPAGVRTRRWYGCAVQIAWHDVAELKGADPLGQSTIVSVTGRRIVHTSLHADGAGFRREVSRHACLTPRIAPQ